MAKNYKSRYVHKKKLAKELYCEGIEGLPVAKSRGDKNIFMVTQTYLCKLLDINLQTFRYWRSTEEWDERKRIITEEYAGEQVQKAYSEKTISEGLSIERQKKQLTQLEKHLSGNDVEATTDEKAIIEEGLELISIIIRNVKRIKSKIDEDDKEGMSWSEKSKVLKDCAFTMDKMLSCQQRLIDMQDKLFGVNEEETVEIKAKYGEDYEDVEEVIIDSNRTLDKEKISGKK